MAAAHVIKKNLSLLQALDVDPAAGGALSFRWRTRQPEIAAAARHRLGIQSDRPFAIINPGAAWPNKRWPAVYFAEVAVALKTRHGLPSIVLWGPGEERLAQRCRGRVRKGPPRCRRRRRWPSWFR